MDARNGHCLHQDAHDKEVAPPAMAVDAMREPVDVVGFDGLDLYSAPAEYGLQMRNSLQHNHWHRDLLQLGEHRAPGGNYSFVCECSAPLRDTRLGSHHRMLLTRGQ